MQAQQVLDWFSQLGRRQISQTLRNKVEEAIVERQKVFKDFKKQHDKTKVGDITVGSVVGGMRGMLGMLYETSKLHNIKGIHYRGHDLFEVRRRAPTAPGGTQPLPEAVLWLLLTGQFPSTKECNEFQEELGKRGIIPSETEKLIQSFPKDMHPMTQFSMGVLACQPQSKFAKAYQSGIHKSKYWESTYEDALDLCAKVSRIAALVYANCYRNDKLPNPDPSLDYGANFASMLGKTDKDFWELMRLYLVLHADHEGGNVSAHATHLVGSALSDPYLSFSAGMNGLAGPLHGLANQECLRFVQDFFNKYGKKWSEDDIKRHVKETLAGGQVIPGYGHAVLRETDPRFVCELEFADQYIKNNDLVDLVKAFYRIIPDELKATGKVSNPFPNVDAGSGALLMHYGLKEYDFYTVLFGVSRAFGVASAQVWSRALSLPIERPNSDTLDGLMDKVKKTQSHHE